MNFFQRIWTDIRKGDNIDLYLTVLIALVLVILNIFGVALQGWLSSMTLAVLGLLAISMLGNRHRVEEVLKKLSQTPDSVFLDEFPSSLRNDIESSTSLLLAGVTLGRTTKTYYSLFERKLQRGENIRILLVNPDGGAIEMADSRAYWSIDTERLRVEIRGRLADLCHLKKIAPERIEIRTIQYPLSYGATLVNPDSSPSILYIEHYPYKVERESIPKYILRSQDGYWYNFFKAEILKLWETATEWECKQSESQVSQDGDVQIKEK
jgi:hypothetical protein